MQRFGGVQMPVMDLPDWIDAYSAGSAVWYAKRLSANDTQASGGHQGGPLIPRDFIRAVFPSVNQPQARNPDKRFDLCIDSHSDAREARVVWYNQRTRNETRITGLGGRNSVLLDPERTGALAVFAFPEGRGNENDECHVWVCDHETEADLIEERIGPVDPGRRGGIWTADETQRRFLPAPDTTSCWLKPDDIPAEWVTEFPSTEAIIRKAIELRPLAGVPVDTKLIRRRDCEYEVFLSVEEATELPVIRGGFESMGDFIARAQSILQRRKSRAGRSLELNVRELFLEENLREGQDFQYQPESEANKRPDFLFPSEERYKDGSYPTERLMMLGVKTTVRDRWRQVVTEADRIGRKHLLTVQEGVSVNQFEEMRVAGIQLVVPQPLIVRYPRSVQPHLQTLESFIADVRLLNVRR